MADPTALRTLAWAALDLYEVTDPLDVPLASVVRRARQWELRDFDDRHVDQEVLWDEACFEFLLRYSLGFTMSIDVAEDPPAAIAEGIHRHLAWTVRCATVLRFVVRRRPGLDAARLRRWEITFEQEVWAWWIDRVGDAGTPRSALLPTWLGPAEAVCLRWLREPGLPHPTRYEDRLVDRAQRALLG
jgi:hypothetical protein